MTKVNEGEWRVCRNVGHYVRELDAIVYTAKEVDELLAARCAQVEASKQNEIDAAVVEAVSSWVEKFEAAGCTVSGFVVTNKRAEAVEAQLAQAKEAAQDARDIADRNERLVLAAESEVTKLREQNRWIPVEEKLPEQYASALIAHSETHNGLLTVEEAQWDGEKWMLVRTDPCDSSIWLKEQVTHWRPLPEPPLTPSREADND
jgi:hypothetical protein